mmetsp:Transcript_1430/g.2452  ORF Transcript_1430/g.2452 Transcript_1430/m.2452 type:complete len:196 (+) Transcript_1430:144-731(+)|eukprot:CAMPEP_0201665336 /NCGR_PEP_ID=MMETSP0494-20130426/6515_1 /ASSEMBLY_ACC=CAM_ASM_000839 /TAXON_ID=420259 /ORGANISM="Thalassiosira gravida, Strain GMp14c1" /LENGTH=195 /DNA_ID=CAMNT_0048144271 /DNA_START=217 /DNA_END=804 /DNA_ORIENTATION=+
MMMKLLNSVMLPLVASILLFYASTTTTTEAFSPVASRSTTLPISSSSPIFAIGRRSLVIARASSQDDEDGVAGLPTLPSQKDAPSKQPAAASSSPVESSPAVAAAKAESEEELQSYPINLPSPILLSTSMVLAISSIGSLYELAGGNPKIGFAATAALAALGLPLSAFLIYAAILKGAAESEEDDLEYMNQSKRL